MLATLAVTFALTLVLKWLGYVLRIERSRSDPASPLQRRHLATRRAGARVPLRADGASVGCDRRGAGFPERASPAATACHCPDRFRRARAARSPRAPARCAMRSRPAASPSREDTKGTMHADTWWYGRLARDDDKVQTHRTAQTIARRTSPCRSCPPALTSQRLASLGCSRAARSQVGSKSRTESRARRARAERERAPLRACFMQHTRDERMFMRASTRGRLTRSGTFFLQGPARAVDMAFGGDRLHHRTLPMLLHSATSRAVRSVRG